MLVFITHLCVITQIGNKHQHRKQTCPFPWCFSPMLSGTTSSRFCVSSRSVRASRPFSSDGSSSRRFSDTSRHTNLRRFPSSYTHTHKLPLTVSYRDTIQSSKHKKKKTASGSKFCMNATVWNFMKIRTFKQTNKKTKKLYLLVVMRTTGYGPATAPLGWGEPRGYPAKGK